MIKTTNILSSAPPHHLSQQGPEGIRFDFNDGCRVFVPQGKWRVVLKDANTHSVLFSSPMENGTVHSNKKYFVKFSIEIFKEDQLFFTHTLDLENKPVLVWMREGGIGDHLAWLGQALAFGEQHRCNLTCCVRPEIIPLLQPLYKDVTFISTMNREEEDFYASYKVLIFYDDREFNHSPVDYRNSGLEQNSALILGMSPLSRPPKLHFEDKTRPIEEKYVCIATQATSQNKYWNNPKGWIETIRFLNDNGYRVICIDRDKVNGLGTIWNKIPYGAEDATGSIPLTERARWLKHADFFIGLSSGLSWLAWAVGVPTVLISGFTRPDNEFFTPFRIINWHTCNGCSNDVTHRLDPRDYFWCPRHAGTPRHFECTRMITSQFVIDTIKQIPTFKSAVA